MPALALAVVTLSAAAAPPAGYAVFPVRSAIADDTKIGPRRSGLACGPAGTLRWSAFALNGERAAVTVAAGLAGAGIQAEAADPALDQDGDGRTRISVEITALSANLCLLRFGPLKLGPGGLKGEGTMEVRWRAMAGGRRLLLDVRTSAAFAVRSPGSALSAALTAGLSANAAQVAPLLQAAAEGERAGQP